MATKTDLFDDSTMTFGEHLEVLRFHLIRALLGLMIGVILSLIFGEQLVRVIRKPIDAALRRADYSNSNRVQDNIEGFDLWKSIGSGIWNQFVPPSISEEDKKAIESIETLTETEKKVVTLEVSPFDLVTALHQVAPDQFPEPKEELKDSPTVKLPATSAAFGDFRRTAEKVNQPVTLNVQEAFMTYMKVSFIAGLIVSSPWIFYQLWLFVAAGLYPHERKYVHTYLPMSIGLFLGGVSFCFYAVLPVVLDFLLGFNSRIGITAQIRISEWINFAVLLPLMFGISFQLPLVMLFLTKINVFQAQHYVAQWKLAVLAISAISMVLTPTPDPATMMLMMVPLLLLYVLGVALCYWSEPKSPLGDAA
ncbi:twin-arginine translocase subunit TatC [Schlesneria paludicola]|uniref:twin-arginine translocase subunit TatC n=1 Tax=Schlesneria paludicola TaxID=360056 RepID=UPI00029AFCED|nr:twin-arginine translocase subunit TatC [Schlesneria paludicola]